MEKKAHNQFLKNFGENLTKLRKKHKITKLQLAFEIGTHEKQIRLIEKGAINTGILTIYKIADALGIHAIELLDFEPTKD